MEPYKVVFDTNILVAALKSRKGASFKLLSLVGTGKFELSISVPLIIEYEDVLKRKALGVVLSEKQIDEILDYICTVADKRSIFYLWRPYLKDPKDDMVLELAVESECDFIITYNIRHFEGIEKFNIKAVTPVEFLKLIGEL